MAQIDWLRAKEPGSATVLNRPMQQILAASGFDPNADFPGFKGLPVAASDAERDALITAPTDTTVVYRPDKKVIQRYDPNTSSWLDELKAGGGDVAVANKAARDAAFPAPAPEDRAIRIDYGAVERFAGGNWTSITESKRSENPIGKGADPTAAVDSRQAFVDTEALGRDIALTKGTYKISANVTLAGSYRFEKGAVIRPDFGVVVSIAGPISAGHYKLFDCSLGGSFDFTGNKSIDEFKASWFGVVADGVTDDSVALTQMSTMVPDYSTIRFARNMDISLTYAWLIDTKTHLKFTTGIKNIQGDNNAKFRWRGPVGGRMIINYDCSNSIFEGLKVVNYDLAGTNYADVNIDSCGEGVSIVTTGGTVSITSGLRVVNDSGNNFTASMVGRRISIPGAGVAGTPFVSIIATYVNAGQVTLDTSIAPASNTVAGKIATIGSSKTSTATLVKFCALLGYGLRPTWYGFRVGYQTGNNNEFSVVEDTLIQSIGAEVTSRLGTIGAGSNALAVNSAVFNAGFVGRTVRIANAGAGGGMLETTIATYVDSTHVTLAAPAVGAVAGGYTLIDKNFGTGIGKVGGNAGVGRVERCQLVGLGVGVNGNFACYDNIYSANEIDLVDVPLDKNADVEHSRQHLTMSTGAHECSGARIAFEFPLMNHGMFELAAGAILTLHDCTQLGDGVTMPDPSCKVVRALNGKLVAYGNNVNPSMTLAQFGIDPVPTDGNNYDQCTIFNNPGLIIDGDSSQGRFFDTSSYGKNRAGHIGRGFTFSESVIDPARAVSSASGLRGEGHTSSQGWPAENLPLAAIEAVIDISLGNANTRKFWSGISQFSDFGNDQGGATIAQYDAWRALSPLITNGRLTKAGGWILDPQALAWWVTKGAGFVASGGRDVSVFAGGATVGDVTQADPTAGLDVYNGLRVRGAIAIPAAPTVTPQGTTGGTGYSYYIVAVDQAGRQTPPSPVGSTATGNGILNSSHFNRITWAHVTGAAYYIVLRGSTATSIDQSGFKVLAPVGGGTVTYDDIGNNTSPFVPATQNTTGYSQIDGPLTQGAGHVIKSIRATVADGDNYTPDAGNGEEFLLSCAGDILINAPLWNGGTVIPLGAELTIEFYNLNIGAKTPTFNAIFKHPAMVAVGVGKRSTKTWRFDGTFWNIRASIDNF